MMSQSSSNVHPCGRMQGNTDMDEEDLVAFTSMAQHAMKIERLVIEQKEKCKKLGEKQQKMYQREKKEQEMYDVLHKDIQSLVARNKLLKENLQGKRENRLMMEQMSTDLERQLHLERNSIINKAAAYRRTENNYAEMWLQYESVYLGSEEAKKLAKIQSDKIIVSTEVQSLENFREAIKQEYKLRAFRAVEDRNKMVVEIVKLIGNYWKAEAKIKKIKASLQDLKIEWMKAKKAVETMQKEVDSRSQALALKNPEISEVPENVASLSDQGKDRAKHLKKVLNFDTFSLPELKLPDLTVEQEVDMFTLTEKENFGYLSNLQDEDVMSDDSGNNEDEQQLQLPVSQTEAEATEKSGMDTEERSVEPMEFNNPDVEMYEGQQSEVPHCEPVDLQTVEQSEVPPPVEENVVSQQVETETDTADAVMTEQEVSEPMMEEHMPQGETSSQIESEGNYAPGEPYYPSAMSQSSEGSSLDLLDDEKRKAFMMKLMASPEFSVAMRESENEQPYQNYAQTVSNGPDYMTQLIAPGIGKSTENNVCEEATNVANTENQHGQPLTTNSLFGAPLAEEQTTSSETNAFSFGAFSFGASSNTSAGNLFGGNSIFGSSPAETDNNPFGTSFSSAKSSEAFNLNFDNRTNTSSIFKLF